MATRSELKLNDVVVSKVEDGHHLLIVTAMPDDQILHLPRRWLERSVRGGTRRETCRRQRWRPVVHVGRAREPRVLGNISLSTRAQVRPLALPRSDRVEHDESHSHAHTRGRDRVCEPFRRPRHDFRGARHRKEIRGPSYSSTKPPPRRAIRYCEPSGLCGVGASGAARHSPH